MMENMESKAPSAKKPVLLSELLKKMGVKLGELSPFGEVGIGFGLANKFITDDVNQKPAKTKLK